jgi:predicted neuraminidase
MTRTRPIALPSGRILLPLYSDGFNASLMAISDDLGETWRASGPIIGLGPIQPTLAQRRNGEIVALCRDSGRAPSCVMKSVSRDDGETWSLARDTDLPNPGSSLAVVALRDGRWVLVYNDTESGRHRLAVALSEDEGETWPWKRYLDAAEPSAGSFSYPTAIEGKDGRIHVTYSHRDEGGASIKHAAFEPDWVREK